MEQYNFYKILSDIEIVLLGKTPAGLEIMTFRFHRPASWCYVLLISIVIHNNIECGSIWLFISKEIAPQNELSNSSIRMNDFGIGEQWPKQMR